MNKFKIGDRIRRISNPAKWAPIGYETIVTSDGYSLTYTDKRGDMDVVINYPDWEIVENGPVRTVTRREIVPGCYGRVIVRLSGKSGDLESHKSWVSLGFTSQDWNADELRSAAMILSQLAEALDENKGDGE